MLSQNLSRIRFGNFEFDKKRVALYYGEELVRVERKALEVLTFLLESHNELVSTDELIDRVWKDNSHGVTPVHLAQAIKKLRKALADYEPDTEFIENIRGSGYIFKAPVEQIAKTSNWITDLPEIDQIPVELPEIPSGASTQIGIWLPATGLGLLVTAALILFAIWSFYPADDEKEIRRVLEESQKFESLVMYRHPDSFDVSKLDEYWLPETDYGVDVDIRRIRAGLDKLQRESKFYGSESKCEQFDFQWIEINNERDFATVRTLEKWFLAEYQNDGTLVRNKTVGPYFVHYILRKTEGRWKVEKSSTARATKPPPIIESLQPLSNPIAGHEFFINIQGQGIEPDSVFVRVIGPGCPDVLPCTVPNSAIRIHSSLSDNVIDKIPVTLKSGHYSIYLQNGESIPSNSEVLVVP